MKIRDFTRLNAAVHNLVRHVLTQSFGDSISSERKAIASSVWFQQITLRNCWCVYSQQRALTVATGFRYSRLCTSVCPSPIRIVAYRSIDINKHSPLTNIFYVYIIWTWQPCNSMNSLWCVDCAPRHLHRIMRLCDSPMQWQCHSNMCSVHILYNVLSKWVSPRVCATSNKRRGRWITRRERKVFLAMHNNIIAEQLAEWRQRKW